MVRQLLVLFVGTTIIITGLLMLILPGPGWAAIFLGFAILATEFTLAEKVRDWMIARLKHLYHLVKKRTIKWWHSLKWR